MEARTNTEESAYSRNAVGLFGAINIVNLGTDMKQFYNLVIFISSVAAFSLIAQRMSTGKATIATS